MRFPLNPNIDICKETRRLLEYCSAGPSEALFSCLGPASSTPIHEGPTNTVLTCHLPLIVPSNCAIRVASETRSWKQDEVMVFDMLHGIILPSRAMYCCLKFGIQS